MVKIKRGPRLNPVGGARSIQQREKNTCWKITKERVL